MKRLSFALVGAALAAVSVLSACHHSTTTSSTSTRSNNAVAMGAVNDKCPVSGAAVNKDIKTATFEGQSVGFCCPKCESRWNAMSTADKEAWLAKNANR